MLTCIYFGYYTARVYSEISELCEEVADANLE